MNVSTESREEEPPVLLKRHGETQLIILNRPSKRNALDIPLRNALADAIVQCRDDDTVKAVVITGNGDTFCAGGDLAALTEERRSNFKNRERIKRLHLWCRELINLEKPVIAAVNGFAFGAGFNLALAADFILVTPQTRFSAVFGRIGLVPDLGGFFLLPRIVGLQRAKEIVFTARTVDADEAIRLGIAFAQYPAETLLDEALSLAERFWPASTEAIGLSKTILNQSFHLDQQALADLEAYAQAVVLNSDYHLAAASRFLAKTPLEFNWDKRR